MKNNVMLMVLFVLIGAVLGWVGYEAGVQDLQKWLLAGAAFLGFLVCGVCLCMISGKEDYRVRINARVLLWSMMSVFVVMDVIFAFFEFSAVAFVAPNAVLLWLLCYGVYRIGQPCPENACR